MAQVDISEDFSLSSTVCDEGEIVELAFSGGTEVLLSFTRRGFEQFREQWAEVLAKADARFEEYSKE
ncbi:hypothetical protein [Saccharothrix coeruleofusca]|nr:hypothetical protein [Saccharothrix coeruleofusca]